MKYTVFREFHQNHLISSVIFLEHIVFIKPVSVKMIDFYKVVPPFEEMRVILNVKGTKNQNQNAS